MTETVFSLFRTTSVWCGTVLYLSPAHGSESLMTSSSRSQGDFGESRTPLFVRGGPVRPTGRREGSGEMWVEDTGAPEVH